jgi:hypothetical protein
VGTASATGGQGWRGGGLPETGGEDVSDGDENPNRRRRHQTRGGRW